MGSPDRALLVALDVLLQTLVVERVVQSRSMRMPCVCCHKWHVSEAEALAETHHARSAVRDHEWALLTAEAALPGRCDHWCCMECLDGHACSAGEGHSASDAHAAGELTCPAPECGCLVYEYAVKRVRGYKV